MNDSNQQETLAGTQNGDIDLLIVDDETDFRETAFTYFKRMGYRVEQAEDGEEAINVSTNRKFDVAIVDIHMPGMSGIRLLEHLMKLDPHPKVIMLTGGGTIENAVDSMKKGAYDFVTKPVKLPILDTMIQRACQSWRLEKENAQLKAVIKRQTQNTHDIVGDSPVMQEVYRLIEKTAPSKMPVLIQGESGTGKELAAQAIHRLSLVADKPMVTINCAALAEQLLESELFGHEKGAFTGAVASKPGLFEVADGGTLFIDEFGEMGGALQAKLLRVLEDGSMRRVGSITERRVSVRLIAATNRDLEKEVREHRFREDLYYRINVLTIPLPPLRQRLGDVELLVQEFLGDDWSVTPEALQRLCSYSWPGNVRQLRNAIERARVLADDAWITLENLPPGILAADAEMSLAAGSSNVDLESLNRQHVAETYRRCDRNKTKTARSLGINRRSLYRLLEKYDIE